MLRTVLALSCFLCASTAVADTCDDLAMQIAQATGTAKVGKRVGPSIDIKTAAGVDLDLTCRADPIVQAISRDPSPGQAYFQDLATAAQIVIGEPLTSVRIVVDTAYQIAIEKGRKSFIQQRGWSASCYSDPGSTLRTLCSVSRIPPH